jgi:hypothetical protein
MPAMPSANRPPRLEGVLVLACLALLVPAASAVRAAEPTAKDKARAALVKDLRKALAAKEDLRGVLVPERGQTDGDRLLLTVIVDRLDTRAAIQNALGTVRRSAEFRKVFPDGVSVDRLVEFPLLRRAQAAFADSGLWKDKEKDARVLAATRLDGVSFDDGDALTFTGVCATALGVDPDDCRATVRRALRDLLRKEPAFLLADHALGQPNCIADITLPPLASRPTNYLQQKVAEDRSLDGTLIRGVSYDANGVLHVAGLLNAKSDAARARVNGFLRTRPAWPARPVPPAGRRRGPLVACRTQTVAGGLPPHASEAPTPSRGECGLAHPADASRPRLFRPRAGRRTAGTARGRSGAARNRWGPNRQKYRTGRCRPAGRARQARVRQAMGRGRRLQRHEG